jgi:two-component system response regulator TctD
VLLVEDDAISASALAAILRRRGFEVHHVLSVAGGIESLGESPAVVILDLMLPDGEGSAVLREIRRRGLVCRVLVTTASSEPDRLDTLNKLQPDMVLQKPIDLPLLLEMMRPLN